MAARDARSSEIPEERLVLVVEKLLALRGD